MMVFRRLRTAACAVGALLATACLGDSSVTAPTAPVPLTDFTAVTVNSSSITYSFTSVTGDGSYFIERAEGATGTFVTDSTITAPIFATTISITRTGLKAATLYRFRVTSQRGTVNSAPTAEKSVTTLGLGNATADVAGDITANRTLFADTVYTLKGFIHVANGATLTIQPGTKVQGDYATLGSSLWVLRGAKLKAVGTADLPIVFTSSRAAGQRQPGDWGGVVIVGNAPDNRSGTVTVEASGSAGSTSTSGTNYAVTYTGGTIASDNSGTLAYVRVEFAGYSTVIDQGLNALTFAAVGSGTRASYIEAMASLNDAYKFFGGGFDLDHLVAFESADDMLDMTEGFSGRLQYVIGYNSVPLAGRSGAGFASADVQGLESDGCVGAGCDLGFASTPYTIPLVANFTLIGCGAESCSGAGGGYGLMLRRGTGGFFVNGLLGRWARGGVSLRDSLTWVRAGQSIVPDLANTDLLVSNSYFAETPAVFQAVTAAGASVGQYAFDLGLNSLTLLPTATTAATLFAALPPTGGVPASIASFDFTPATSSPLSAGGLGSFAGKLAIKGGSVVTGTAYVGAVAPGGTKWWQGWTTYVRN
jgi:hypothetical protein